MGLIAAESNCKGPSEILEQDTRASIPIRPVSKAKRSAARALPSGLCQALERALPDKIAASRVSEAAPQKHVADSILVGIIFGIFLSGLSAPFVHGPPLGVVLYTISVRHAGQKPNT